jgi:signal transduction histidine kinase
MLQQTEHRDTTDMLDESQVPVHVTKDLWRSKETYVRAIRMINLSLRSKGCQENIPAVEWLSTSILHDLRNPLGAIYAAAEMLMEVDAAPTQVKRLATNIYRAAGRMRELLADLNSVARACNLVGWRKLPA